jgi:hypothetical protein
MYGRGGKKRFTAMRANRGAGENVRSERRSGKQEKAGREKILLYGEGRSGGRVDLVQRTTASSAGASLLSPPGGLTKWVRGETQQRNRRREGWNTRRGTIRRKGERGGKEVGQEETRKAFKRGNKRIKRTNQPIKRPASHARAKKIFLSN